MPAAPPLYLSILLVGIGGAGGAGGRFLVGRGMAALSGPAMGWPAATLAINIGGSLAMGVLTGVLARSGPAEPWRLLLGVGVLGGFTTFSAFSLELAQLIRDGATVAAALYALASVGGGLGALFLGLWLAGGPA